MKIGVISDTHDHLENIDRAFEMLGERGVEMVVHCGDWVAPFAVERCSKRAGEIGAELKGVLGNNDGEVFMILSKNEGEDWGIELGKRTLEIEAGTRTLIAYHGTDANLASGLIEGGAFDAVFSGHTHEQRNEMVRETLALNPGTLSGYSPQRGTLDQGELAVYDADTNTAELLTFPLS